MLNKFLNLDENVEIMNFFKEQEQWNIILTLSTKSANCPTCHTLSSRPHCRYTRNVQDLPINNQKVSFIIQLRKWFCDHSNCETKIFTQRLSWLAPYGRRTKRCDDILRTIAFFYKLSSS